MTKPLALALALLACGLTAAVKKKRPAAPAPKPVISHALLDEIQQRAQTAEGVMEGADSLAPFFEQLYRSAASPVHILQYGDSHTASDDWAGAMRAALQSRFGDGGPGFVLAGRPFRGYRRFDATANASPGWLTEGTVGHPGDGRLGLGGLSITAPRAGETIALETDASYVRLCYLQQPVGGVFEVAVDHAAPEIVTTEGPAAAAYYPLLTNPGGAHLFTVRSGGNGPVRLLGWMADKPTGVTYETLGINGAQPSMILNWDLPLLESSIAERKPALIVAAYGTNEALSPRFTTEDYSATFSRAIARLKHAAPEASILIAGPPDGLMRLQNGARTDLPHIEAVIAIQRRVARDLGCAFWDWRARMGGPGAIREWVRAGLGQPDHIHQTGPGYRLTAFMLFQELMQQYNRFTSNKSE